MSKIGRNDPCPSGAGVKFKKCLLKHPQLRADATLADVWWLCDQWVAPIPDYRKLCESLVRVGEQAPVAKVQALLNLLFQLPQDSVMWSMVLSILNLTRYEDWAGLFRHVRDHVPDTITTQLAYCYSSLARRLAATNPQTVPELVEAFLRLPADSAYPDAVRQLHRELRAAGHSVECARLEERFGEVLANTAQPETEPASQDSWDAKGSDDERDDWESESDETEDDSPDDIDPEINLPPEIEAKLDELWNDFDELTRPGVQQMDELVTALLALPPEGTQWSDLFHRFSELKYPDLAGLFRRIAEMVPHTSATGMNYFYWAAMEEFMRHGLTTLLPEVAMGFRRLDCDSYDADCLKHIEDYLLAHGYAQETLELAEQFLPILRADGDVTPWVVPQVCYQIFDLRVGRRLGIPPRLEESLETISKELRSDLEEEVHEDCARMASELVSGRASVPVWTRNHFELPPSGGKMTDQLWALQLGALSVRIWTARDIGLAENVPPGIALRGLALFAEAAQSWIREGRKNRKRLSRNLLEYLRPVDLEERVARHCHEFIGVNKPQAKLLLETHAWLARFARRTGLFSEAQSAQTEQGVARLLEKLD